MTGDPPNEIDVGSLPSGMRERFALLLAIGSTFSFWLGGSATIFIFDFGGGMVSFSWSRVAGFASFVVLTALIYLAHPRRVQARFGNGIPLPDSLRETCEQLREQSEVGNVEFRITRNVLQQDAMAFGYPTHRMIYLGGGMKLVFNKNPLIFRAVLAHEISHLRHGDVDIGYLSRAIFFSVGTWAALVLTAYIVRFVLGINSDALYRVGDIIYSVFGGTDFKRDYITTWLVKSFEGFAFETLSMAFFVLLASIEYRAVLRSRELYADAGAARLVGSDALLSVVGAQKTSRRWWPGDLWSFHPTPDARRHSLLYPLKLLNPSILEAGLAGYYTGILAQMLNLLGTFGDPYRGSYSDYVNQGSSSVSVALTLAIPIILMILCLLVIASQNLRSCISFSLNNTGFRHFSFGALKGALAVIAGLIAGVYANPIFFEQKLLSLKPVVYDTTDKQYLLIGLFCAIIVTSGFFGFFMKQAFPISRMQPLSSIMRLYLLAMWIWLAVYVFQAVGMLSLDEPELGLGDGTKPIFVAVVGLYALLPISALAIAAVLRRRRARRKLRADAQVS